MPNKKEFYTIVDQYRLHSKVLEMKNYIHHGINRYDHCFRVAYHTYNVTKLLHLNYESATKAAMLHDFWTDELIHEKSGMKRFRNHPSIAVENAKKYFTLTELEEDIIKKHMFPITLCPPKYLESWIVDCIDDIASVYERCYASLRDAKSYANLLVVALISIIR